MERLWERGMTSCKATALSYLRAKRLRKQKRKLRHTMAESRKKPYSTRDFQLNTDLEKAAIYQLDFLKCISSASILFSKDVLESAIWRYEHLWLPLTAESQETVGVLPAPLDMEYVWHCHLLSPLAYQEDCLAVVGRVVDHKLFSLDERRGNLTKSKALWERKYPGEAFDYLGLDGLNDRESHNPVRANTTGSKITYDIMTAMYRQKDFYYQVSLPHFKDAKFLATALDRYRRFLYLRQQFPSVFLVPSYDIDLMWHTHQLHPKHYQRDTQLLLGRSFNHDDSVNDRSPGSKLSIAAPETRALWKDTFGEEFTMYGAMYRGHSPVGRLHDIPTEILRHLATKSSTVTIKKIDVEGLTCSQPRIKMDVALVPNDALKLHNSDMLSHEQATRLKGQGSTMSGENLVTFRINTIDYAGLKFSLNAKSGKFFSSSGKTVGSAVDNIVPIVEGCPLDGGVVSRTLALSSFDHIKLSYVATFQTTKTGPIALTVIPGPYERYIIPNDVEGKLGPIPLLRFSTDTENICEVASHRLMSHTGEVEFACRVIHNLPQMMSAIKVFYLDKMAAVAHVIGPNQLPFTSQVCSSQAYTCPNPPQRAILIKNHAGDWGILSGEWVEMKEGIPGKKPGWLTWGRRGVWGNPGHLKVDLYKMADGTRQVVHTMYQGSAYNVHTNNVKVNMRRGSITLKSPYKDVPENIALAFSIALLHVLCQHRPEDWKRGYITAANARGTKPKLIPSEDMLMVVAAGYAVHAPRNRYLYSMRHIPGLESWIDGEKDGGCGGCGGCGSSGGGRRTFGRGNDGGDGCGDGGGCGGGGCGGGGCGGGG